MLSKGWILFCGFTDIRINANLARKNTTINQFFKFNCPMGRILICPLDMKGGGGVKFNQSCITFLNLSLKTCKSYHDSEQFYGNYSLSLESCTFSISGHAYILSQFFHQIKRFHSLCYLVVRFQAEKILIT